MIANTCRAILLGDHVEWIDTPPAPDGPTQVAITLIAPPQESAEQRRARRRLAVEALAELAAAGGIASIPDPAAWEREIRQDRGFPA